jgi:hypothetical protein
MKKLVCILAVIALAAPLYAADPNVTISCEDLGCACPAEGKIRVSFEADSEAAAAKVRGMAFDIALVGDGCSPTYRGMVDGSFHEGESKAASGRGYGIYMGSIMFNQQDPNNVDSWGDPQAPEDDPGAAGGYGDSSFTVELGSLYDPDESGDAPDQSGVLFEFYYDCNDCCGEPGNPGHFTVEITENAVRGGLVLEDGGSADLISTGCDVYCEEPSSCMADTNPDYQTWDDWGRPDCWCYPRQCRGDADGIKQLIFWVFAGDLNIIRAAYGKNDADLALVPSGICADFDHTKQLIFRVFAGDLNIIRGYYGKNEASTPVCSGPGSGSDENPLPNSEYNFWLSP